MPFCITLKFSCPCTLRLPVQPGKCSLKLKVVLIWRDIYIEVVSPITVVNHSRSIERRVIANVETWGWQVRMIYRINNWWPVLKKKIAGTSVITVRWLQVQFTCISVFILAAASHVIIQPFSATACSSGNNTSYIHIGFKMLYNCCPFMLIINK